MKTTNPEQTSEGSATEPRANRGTELGAAHGSASWWRWAFRLSCAAGAADLFPSHQLGAFAIILLIFARIGLWQEERSAKTQNEKVSDSAGETI